MMLSRPGPQGRARFPGEDGSLIMGVKRVIYSAAEPNSIRSLDRYEQVLPMCGSKHAGLGEVYRPAKY
jgi:hypothetical protein